MPQWIKFNLIKKPFWDGDGNILTSIEGRRNRKGIDEFTGGGRLYPDLDRSKVKEWHQKDDVLLVLVDITEGDAVALETKDKKLKYKASPKIEKEYNYKDFKAKILTEQEAEDLKLAFFGITIHPTGVTIVN